MERARERRAEATAAERDEAQLSRTTSELAAVRAALEQEHASEQVCVAIGETGVGKSSFCNVLVGSRDADEEARAFPASDRGKSMTAATTVAPGQHWFGDRAASATLTVVDTPGLSDRGGADAANLQEMVAALQDVGRVNVFFVLFNAPELQPRLSEHLAGMLKLFGAVFGPAFWDNVVLVFTRWRMDQRTQKRRKKSAAAQQAEFCQEVADVIGEPRLRELPCLFVDSEVECGLGGGEQLERTMSFEDREVEAMRGRLAEARRLASTLPPFVCESMPSVLGRVRELEAATQDLKGRLAEAELRAEMEEGEAARQTEEKETAQAEALREKAAKEKAQAEALREKAAKEKAQAEALVKVLEGGDYDVHSSGAPLGVGQFAKVWPCVHKRTGIEMAVKQIKKRKFLHESRQSQFFKVRQTPRPPSWADRPAAPF